MRAVVFNAPGSLAIEQVADPQCGPDEVIIQVAQTGICGTDLHIYHGEYMGDFPLIPGHEIAGRVVEVGRNVDYIAVGDRVAPDPNIFCNHCAFCRNDQPNHCLNWQGVGITRHRRLCRLCGRTGQGLLSRAGQLKRRPGRLHRAIGLRGLRHASPATSARPIGC